jgi:uncharacterized protein YjbI with pentapeptide repeats
MIRLEEPRIPVSKVRLFLLDGSYWASVFAGARPIRLGPDGDLDTLTERARSVIRQHIANEVGEFIECYIPLIVDPQSRITFDELVNLIEVNGGPRRLDFTGCDLRDLDLSRTAMRARMDQWRESNPNSDPPWYTYGGGIALNETTLEEAHFWDVDLRGASLSGSRLVKSEIYRTTLDDTTLWNTDFTQATIGHGVTFRRAGFYEADLRGVDLFHAHLEGSYWLGARLDRTRLRAECLGTIGEELAVKGKVPYRIQAMLLHPTFHDAKEAYLALKNNFASIGRYADAQWAYVKERQMDKASCFPTAPGHLWMRLQSRKRTRVFSRLYSRSLHRRSPKRLRWVAYQVASCIYHIRLFLGLCPKTVKEAMRAPRDFFRRENLERVNRPRWVSSWAYELLTGYGERPLNPVAGGGFAVVAFALGYFFTGAINNFLDALVYSLATFATFNLADLQPHGRGVDIASSFEALLGIAVLALVVFTLGNRMSRS